MSTDYMATVYADLIRKGKKTLAQVPKSLQKKGESPAGGGQQVSVLRELMLKILLKKEVDVMAVVYATLIIKGRKTIDQVPAIIRDEVKQILKDLEVEV